MSIGFYAILPLVIALAILQASLLHALPIFGIVPALWLIVAVAWSLFRGMREGLLIAFVTGLIVDLLSAAPLGTTSLSLMLAIAIATFLQRHLPRNQTLMPALLTALATVLFWFVYLLILRLIMPAIIGGQDFLGITELRVGGARNSVLNDVGRGYGLSASVLRLVVVSAIIHALLVIPFYWLINTLQRLYGRRRVDI
jgi:rod shape-determining protein MreD